MGLFDTVKEAVTTRQAAEHYGLKVDRSGKTCCIFHDDRHPSMKVDERFHCFSCGADGDVIDFTARLFDMSLTEAARKLAADFGLSCERTAYSSVKPKASNSLIKRLKTYQNENYRALCNYYHLLRQWDEQYAPGMEDEEWHPRFIEAIQNSAKVEYLLEELQVCSPDEARKIISLYKNDIGHYANRVREVRAEERQVSHDLTR